MATKTGFNQRELDRLLKKKIQEEMKKRVNLKKVKASDLEEVGEVLRDEVLDSVSKGKSPIKGGGRYAAYKNPESYPDKARKKHPSKRRRPVNLNLSGDFYKALKYKVKVGANPRVTLGFFDKKNKLKEKGHREGANGQPKRPMIPAKNEEFSPVIKRNVFKKLVFILNKAFSR